ncbi:MAG: phosphatase PAP2 family protein [Actinophytocola sp.]|uniref:phosphatase PAP2 family protein n=1 Tax=Actinophytocola sp. TaxID=1872138 RepID=UPI00132AB0BD|nr:phosphatase PAP2 family protein [Actinophytocola sp.]MPZ85830.1 phosphatase PAP2 family protein [Actinophytocola sp.]
MPAVRVALVGVLALAAVALTVTVGRLVTLDTTWRTWLIDRRSPPLTAVMTGITTVGSTPVLVAVAIGISVWRLAGHHPREALLVGGTTAGAVVLGPLLKSVVERSRPGDAHLVLVNSWAYPSGHSLTSTAVIGVLTALAFRRPAAGRRRTATVTAGAALVVAVGISRVYLGVHWPTDVLAGWLIGASWLAVCLLMFSTSGPVRRGSPR